MSLLYSDVQKPLKSLACNDLTDIDTDLLQSLTTSSSYTPVILIFCVIIIIYTESLLVLFISVFYFVYTPAFYLFHLF